MSQHTLSADLTIKGIGLHSGCDSTLVLHPAPADHGIVFVRSDLPEQPRSEALYSNVTDTRNCTCLSDGKGHVVSTIEHLMAALSICGVDNALIEVNNQELPIMDGSAQPFYEALQSVGLAEQNAPRRLLEVLSPLKFDDGKGAVVELLPAEEFSVSSDVIKNTVLRSAPD